MKINPQECTLNPPSTPVMATTRSQASSICHLVTLAVSLPALSCAFFSTAARMISNCKSDHVNLPPPPPYCCPIEREPSHFPQLGLALGSCFIPSCPWSVSHNYRLPTGPGTHQTPPFSRLCKHLEHSLSPNPRGGPFPNCGPQSIGRSLKDMMSSPQPPCPTTFCCACFVPLVSRAETINC